MIRKSSKKVSKLVKSTILLFGEGQTDKAFLRHLKILYSSGNPLLSVTVEGYHGGDPETIIKEAIKSMSVGYAKVAVLLDTDRPWKKTTCTLAKDKGIIMIGSDPCIEGLLLSIIEGKNYVSKTPKQCKERFNKLYLSKQDATDYRQYSRLFTKQVVDKSKKSLKQIKSLTDLLM